MDANQIVTLVLFTLFVSAMFYPAIAHKRKQKG